jgi:dolichyl-phosphate beta-glucosyltransferase
MLTRRSKHTAFASSNTSEPRVQPELTLVVPLFDEAHRFAIFAPQLCEHIRSFGPRSELVFVDDGSTDDTVAHVQRFIAANEGVSVRLLRRPHLGKGAAVSAGLATAMTEIAAFCDLDLSTPLAELDRIVEAASRAPILAVGSRGAASSVLKRRQHPSRELLGRAYNRLVQLTVVPGIVDTQCGAKAAATNLWQKVLPMCREQGFAWDVEVIAMARALGLNVQEIGIEWSHRDGSRINPVRDGLAMLRAVPRIRRNVSSVLRERGRARREGGGPFVGANAAALADVDADHWWFRSKATFASMCIRREGRTTGRLVDVGGGSGGVSALLGWDPEHTFVVEGSRQLLQQARRRHAVVPIAGDAIKLPLADATADYLCLLDVLEHLSEPVPALRDAARVIGPAGRVIINVPAHPRLWSAADEVLGHARRYTRRTLRRELEQGGLEVVWMSHVFSWLVLPVWWKRRMLPANSPQLGSEVTSPALDRISMVLTRLEWEVVSRMPIPFGTSVLCIARCRRASDGTESTAP